MNDRDKPGISGTQFQIILNENWVQFTDFQYIIDCDPYKVEEPLNFWHKLKSKLGLRYETKDTGWAYTVLKLSQIEGKMIGEHVNRKV